MKTGRRRKPRSEWLQINIGEKLTIIDHSLWLKVQERISQNPKFSPRNAKFSYLLQGLVKCAYCHHTWAGTYCRTREKIYLYYNCYYRPCKKARWIPVQTLDSIVWSALHDALSDPRLLAERIKQAAEELNSEETKVQTENTQSIEDVQRDTEALLFGRYRSGYLSPEQLASELQTLNTARRTQQNPGRPQVVKLAASFDEVCNQVLEKLKNPDFILRRTILRELVSEISVDVSHVRIRLAIPIEPEQSGSMPQTPTPQPLSDENSGAASPLVRECKGNTRMEIELGAALPPPPSNCRNELKARYSASEGLTRLRNQREVAGV